MGRRATAHAGHERCWHNVLRMDSDLRDRLRELSISVAPLPDASVDRVEAALDTTLPMAVRAALGTWSGGQSLGSAHLRSWDPETEGSWSIVDETLRVRRALGWPQRFVYLAEEGEHVIAMDTVTGSVAAFSSTRAPTLRDGSWPPGGAEVEVWPDYLTFLLAMCDEEAEMQAEDRPFD